MPVVNTFNPFYTQIWNVSAFLSLKPIDAESLTMAKYFRATESINLSSGWDDQSTMVNVATESLTVEPSSLLHYGAIKTKFSNSTQTLDFTSQGNPIRLDPNLCPLVYIKDGLFAMISQILQRDAKSRPQQIHFLNFGEWSTYFKYAAMKYYKPVYSVDLVSSLLLDKTQSFLSNLLFWLPNEPDFVPVKYDLNDNLKNTAEPPRCIFPVIGTYTVMFDNFYVASVNHDKPTLEIVSFNTIIQLLLVPLLLLLLLFTNTYFIL